MNYNFLKTISELIIFMLDKVIVKILIKEFKNIYKVNLFNSIIVSINCRLNLML